MREEPEQTRVLLATCPGPPDRCNPSSFYPSRFPLSIHSLKGALLDTFGELVEVTIFDWHRHGGVDELISVLKRDRFDIIGVSVLLNQSRRLRLLLDQIYKAGLTSMPLIVLGNIYTTLRSNELQRTYQDVICIKGEGEYGLLDIVSQFRRGEPIDCSQIRGAAGDVAVTQSENIGMPTTDTLPLHIERNGIIQMETSRGCSWGVCSFCSRLKRGNTWRPINTGRVITTLRNFAANGADLVIFSDEDFLGGGSERGEELASAILESGLHIAFHASLRVSSIFRMTDTIKQIEEKWNSLQLLKKAGLQKVFLGVESGSPTQLKRYVKGANVEENKMAIEILQASGIALSVGFIMFDPFVRVSELYENVRFLAAHRLLGRTYVFNRMGIRKENSLMAKRIEKEGLVCGVISSDGYHQWRFANKNVASIYSFCQSLENCRSLTISSYRELLMDNNPGALKTWKLQLLRKINRENMKADGRLIEALCEPENTSEGTKRELAQCLTMQRIEEILVLINNFKYEIGDEALLSRDNFLWSLEKRVEKEQRLSQRVINEFIFVE